MKINEYISGTKANGYNGDSSIAKRDSKVEGQNKPAAPPEGGDKVQISGKSREIAKARELAGSAPDIRAEKVAEIKSRYEAGTYNVNAEKVAEAILKHSIDETV